MSDIIQVLGITQKQSGCGWHRVLLPLAYMPDSYNHICNIVTEDILKERDFKIMLYNRFSPYDEKWEESKQDGLKIVMDLDDDWDLPYNHPLHHVYSTHKERVLNNIANADMVTCTNERLATKIKKLHKNVVILPNCIPLGEHQYTEDKEPSDKVRIFWAGGSTHMDDLRIMSNPIKRLSIYPNIEMVIGGYTDTDEVSKMYWDNMVHLFTNGGKLPHRKLPGTMPNDYMQHFKHADIMLIPLEQSDWHACKSNLKILEAASKRIPCIVSNVEPYSIDSDAPVLFVNNQRDWYKHITFLINNPAQRERMGNELYEWAKTKYDYKKIGQARREAFGSLIG